MALVSCPACRRETEEKDLRTCSICDEPGCKECSLLVTDASGRGRDPLPAHRLCVQVAKVLKRALPGILGEVHRAFRVKPRGPL